MEFREALPILRLLADGIDPETQQPFPKNSPYGAPAVIRSLHAAIRATEWADRKTSLPQNVGKAWTPEEDQQLRREFHSSVDFHDIARIHGRSRGAIMTRLERLGEMPAPNVAARTTT
jgi:hypothetical protein